MKIRYKRLREGAVIPYAATEMSGGLDVTAAHIEHISDNEVICYLGFAMQPVSKDKPLKNHPYNTLGKINYRIRFSPRSSLTKTNWIIINSPCLGDADYQNEYMIKFRAIPTDSSVSGIDSQRNSKLMYEPFPYKVGDRIAQLWVEEIIPIEFEEGELPNKTDRVGGFGSTNK